MNDKIRIGIAGYGNLGRGVESALAQAPDMQLVGVFTTIAISGAVRGKYLKIAGMLGAHAVLQKPFQRDELLETVRKLLS